MAEGAPARGWNEASYRALVIAMCDHIKPSKKTMTEVSDLLKSRGFNYSFDAINQHVQKLRKQRDGAGSANSTPRKSASGTPKTPGSRKRTTATPSKKTPKMLHQGEFDDDEGDEDSKAFLKMEDMLGYDSDRSCTPKRLKTKGPKIEPDY